MAHILNFIILFPRNSIFSGKTSREIGFLAGVFNDPQIRTTFNNDTFIAHTTNLGFNTNIKLYFVDSDLDFFPDKLGDFSKEQRYQGTWGVNIIADYRWNNY